MEAVYRRAVSGKRRIHRTAENKKVEKRRLIQLITSLFLFLIVFLGRGAFPGLSDNLEKITATDAEFMAAFQRFGDEMAGRENVWDALGNLTAASLGITVPEPQESVPLENDESITSELIEIKPLSKTEQLGLSHYREYGLREYPITDPDKSEPTENVDTEPEIVTAVAQAYNAAGEALPRNVSYQYYELGLDKTVVPVMGTVTSGFEYRTSPISGQREFHLALDIAAPKGTEIGAFADGVVRYIGESDDFGLYLMIDHDNGVATFYAHCSKLLVRKGDVVTCGQTVALVGDTGNATGHHLHFTIEKDNIRLDPSYYVDPS